MLHPGTQGYADVADALLSRRLDFAAVHAPYLDRLPAPPAAVLDIGAGPGHDAAHLAAQGHRVVACEPTPALLAGAQALYPDHPITWLPDGLPDLSAVRARQEQYALILLSGVWFHLPPHHRPAAMAVVAPLVAPGGLLAVSLRHGPVPAGRCMFPVPAEETIAQATGHGLQLVVNHARASIQAGNRAAGVHWTILAFQRPT